MGKQRRNIDEDAVPASSGSAPNDPSSYGDIISGLQTKSRIQIDRFAKLSTFTEQMKFHLDLFILTLNSGNRKDREKAARLRKLLNEYHEWKVGDSHPKSKA